MNIKKKVFLVLLVSIFTFFTSLVLFIIGCNSSILINNYFKYIFLGTTILSFVFLILSILILIKKRHRQGFKKIIFKVILALEVLYAVGCISFVFLLYGPYNKFREWLITTAMQTMNHKYYCQWFYNDEAIKKVLDNNYIKEVDEDTDESLIDHKETKEYASEYEREILEHDPEQTYKVIRFKVNNCNAYLGVVYDPSKVSVGLTHDLFKYGHYVHRMAKADGAVLAVNGGAFVNEDRYGATPLGLTISDGKIITDGGSINGVIGITKDNNLVLLKNISGSKALEMGVRDAVTMGPFLIVNGKSSFISGNGGWGKAARTAIGQRKDGIILLLVVDSNEFRTNGASMLDLTQIMERYGAINAANLDGGTSSCFVEKGELLNDPIDSTLAHKSRGLPTYIKVME